METCVTVFEGRRLSVSSSPWLASIIFVLCVCVFVFGGIFGTFFFFLFFWFVRSFDRWLVGSFVVPLFCSSIRRFVDCLAWCSRATQRWFNHDKPYLAAAQAGRWVNERRCRFDHGPCFIIIRVTKEGDCPTPPPPPPLTWLF